jgi:hypothetical protein
MTDKKPQVLDDGALLGVKPPHHKFSEADEALMTAHAMAASVWEPDSAAPVERSAIERVQDILDGREDPGAPLMAIAQAETPAVIEQTTSGTRPTPDPGINALLDSME